MFFTFPDLTLRNLLTSQPINALVPASSKVTSQRPLARTRVVGQPPSLPPPPPNYTPGVGKWFSKALGILVGNLVGINCYVPKALGIKPKNPLHFSSHFFSRYMYIFLNVAF